MYARPFINSLDFAKGGRQISGEVPVAELPRLCEMLESRQNTLIYTVRGGVDKQGSALLDVHITGQCQLRCQRCLNNLDYPIQLDSRLLLRDQSGLDALDDDEEEFDSILADVHLDVLNLLEEEILLSLPLAPKHALGACRAMEEESVQKEQNPFAILAKLKSM